MLLYRSGNLPKFEASVEALRADRIAFEVMNSAQATEYVPALTLQDEDRAIVLTADGRIDVHELLTSYLRHARNRGAVICTSSEVRDIHSAIDRRTPRHAGYAISQIKRKRVEEIFGWTKTIGGLRKTRHRGADRSVGCLPLRQPPTTWSGCATSSQSSPEAYVGCGGLRMLARQTPRTTQSKYIRN
jgi:hypothetical protein